MSIHQKTAEGQSHYFGMRTKKENILGPNRINPESIFDMLQVWQDVSNINRWFLKLYESRGLERHGEHFLLVLSKEDLDALEAAIEDASFYEGAEYPHDMTDRIADEIRGMVFIRRARKALLEGDAVFYESI